MSGLGNLERNWPPAHDRFAGTTASTSITNGLLRSLGPTNHSRAGSVAVRACPRAGEPIRAGWEIALARPERDGRLSQNDRNSLLAAMTDEDAGAFAGRTQGSGRDRFPHSPDAIVRAARPPGPRRGVPAGSP